MRYWWVNQNQTYEQETRGGYLWSPKRKANDHYNPFYEFMREVAPQVRAARQAQLRQPQAPGSRPAPDS